MSGLAMCANLFCPARFECARHEASGTRPDPERQVYAEFLLPQFGARCEYFVRVERGGDDCR